MTFWNKSLSQEVQLKLAFNRAIQGSRQKCDLETFRRLLIVKLGDRIEERLFEIFANGRCELSCDEFVASVKKFSRMDPEQSVNFLFTLYDREGQEQLDRVSLQCLLETSCKVNDIEYTDVKIRRWTSLLLDGKSFIDREGLQTLVRNNRHINYRVNAYDWFVKVERSTKANNDYRLLQSGYYLHNVKTLVVVVVFFGVCIGLAMERFFSEMALHRDSKNVFNETLYQSVGSCHVTNHLRGLHSMWELVAKIFGQLLNFVCVASLALVLRGVITLMRNAGFNRVLPLDHHIFFHKLIGYIIAVCALGHTLCHVANVITLRAQTSDIVCFLFTAGYPGQNSFNVPPFITGWIMVVVLALIIVFSLPAIRRSGYFQLFYNTHRLYWVFYIMLVLHGPKFWLWLIIPGTMYVGEVFSRITGILQKFGRTQVIKAELYKGDTVGLTIARPSGFKFRCGDYLYLNVPSISKYEWHAFTISSAPEVDCLTLHIRAVGVWTRQLQDKFNQTYRKKQEDERKLRQAVPDLRSAQIARNGLVRRHTIMFSGSNRRSMVGAGLVPHTTIEMSVAKEEVALRNGDQRVSAMKRISKMSRVNPLIERYKPNLERTISTASEQNDIVVEETVTINIDGPYGAPSSDFLDSPHPVLVAAGIGVTPFVSIAQSIIHRYIAMKTQCPHCHNDIIASPPQSLARLRRVDFIWIVRDFSWVTWFKAAFKDLVQNQGEYGNVLKDLIRIKIFVTSPQERVTASNLLLRIALEKENARKNANLQRLRSNVELGRPNWERIIDQIKQEDTDATVFFCGPAALCKDLRSHCLRNKLEFRKEVF